MPDQSFLQPDNARAADPGVDREGSDELGHRRAVGPVGKTVANYVSVILSKIDAADRNEATLKVTRAR